MTIHGRREPRRGPLRVFPTAAIAAGVVVGLHAARALPSAGCVPHVDEIVELCKEGSRGRCLDGGVQVCVNRAWATPTACEEPAPMCRDGACVTPCSSILVLAGTDVAGPVVSAAPDARRQACFEAWAKLAPGGAPGPVTAAIVLGQGANTVGSAGWVAYCHAGSLWLDVYTKVSAPEMVHVTISGTTRCADGGFHHVAVCFAGDRSELYFDGQPLGSQVGVPAVPSLALHMGSWGAYPTAGVSTIDEVRVSSGHRYAGAFVPERRLVRDGETRLLYHFDDGAGTTAREGREGPPLSLPPTIAWVPACRAGEPP
jgi:hypothetical protein